VNRRHFDRVTGYLGDGFVAHGGTHDADDLYVAPTLLTDVPRESPVMRDEIFGPVLPVDTFDGTDEALARVARADGPLAAYLFSRHRPTQERFTDAVRAGGVCVNDTVVHLFGRHLPFGGVGPSGMGRYHGRASFDAFSNHKAVVRASGRIDLPYRYPPVRMPAARFQQFLRLFLRR
jgi:aldehyde dehydrogenase (NAD+)